MKTEIKFEVQESTAEAHIARAREFIESCQKKKHPPLVLISHTDLKPKRNLRCPYERKY